MKVCLPVNTTHSIRFIPRVYGFETSTLILTNEATKKEETVEHEIFGDEGLLTLTFEYIFIEGESFKIRLYNSTDDIYRGRIIATDQEAQNYNKSKNYIEYE